MTGFIDVLLRGLLLSLVSVAVGGVAWIHLVLRVDPGAKPDAMAAASLRLVALAAGAVGLVQAAVVALVGWDVLAEFPTGSLGAYAETTFARVGATRVALALGLAILARRLAARPAPPGLWIAQAALAVGLVVASAPLGHAGARLDARLALGSLTAIHQVAVAVWVGGLAHFTLYAARTRGGIDPRGRSVPRRFSALALASVGGLVASGVLLVVLYVGDWGALVGTAYGVMVLSKVALLLAALGLAAANLRLVRRATAPAAHPRLSRFVEVELGLGVTVLFAAASLTSLPPAVDVRADRAEPREVAARFTPAPPRLTSPPIDELLRAADPLMAPPGERKSVERAWSEYNHHWAGLFVLLMGLGAVAERLGLRAARHWPLVLLGLAAFLFVRNDPRAWPLGPAGFWESMTLPDVLQHRTFVALIVAFAVFEWMVRVGRLPVDPWGRVFPLLCAIAGGLLLTHSHAMFNLKDEFLTEVTHAPLGLLGAIVGWARWIEIRLPEAGPGPGWWWRGCLVAIGMLLLIYREE
jgi:putative copper resistance protein D